MFAFKTSVSVIALSAIALTGAMLSAKSANAPSAASKAPVSEKTTVQSDGKEYEKLVTFEKPKNLNLGGKDLKVESASDELMEGVDEK